MEVPDESWNFVSGPFCWIMVNPKPLAAPIPAKGRLNIWKFTTEAHRLKTSAGPSYGSTIDDSIEDGDL